MELSRIYAFYCEGIALLFVDIVVVSECVEFVCPVESRRSEVEVYGRGDGVRAESSSNYDSQGWIIVGWLALRIDPR
jgi:hypothetical protein